jgi:hypothetical protein
VLAATAVAATAAALASSSTHASTVQPASGFAGVPTSAPRPIDRDLERAAAGTLRRVPCDEPGSLAACWIAKG